MIGRRNKSDIDAVAEIERSELGRVEGERGAAEIGARRKLAAHGSKMFLILAVVCVAAIGVGFTLKAMAVRQAPSVTANKSNTTVASILPPLTLTPLAKRAPLENTSETGPSFGQASDSPAVATNGAEDRTNNAVATANRATPSPSATEKSSANLIRDRRLSPASSESSGSTYNSSTASPVANATGAAVGDNDLQNRLKPLKLNPAVAGMVGDRDLLLTQGAMIDCQLETKIITSQPGMTSCYTTRDIYSANGRVVLVDRGSKVVGNYQAGMKQGTARIFVLWTRIETPKGVIINLDSPGTGPLGESGAGGVIDTHFWERFGGAILISLIGDVGQFAANSAQGSGGGNTIQFSGTAQGTTQAAAEALKNAIDIPPTLYKNQGDRISIFVARDLDFGGVYALDTH